MSPSSAMIGVDLRTVTAEAVAVAVAVAVAGRPANPLDVPLVRLARSAYRDLHD